ncbi:hypothetical protein V6N11_066975 [Hibiscus sabdariffa]|uniref:DUF4283 domain-containing protein n=1 Tax=Hibiscus sabdariffa TaxID=183260 RepID=A0ABR2SPI8_9ROSI
MDCDGHKPLIPAISYRDMLIGGPSPIIYDDLISLGDDDIDLLENDVRTDGPWTIFGHYITVEPWSVDFNPLQEHPSRIMAWVRLPGLPITWYKRSLIEAIGARIGKVVKIDYQTDYGRRGRFQEWLLKLISGSRWYLKSLSMGKSSSWNMRRCLWCVSNVASMAMLVIFVSRILMVNTSLLNKAHSKSKPKSCPLNPLVLGCCSSGCPLPVQAHNPTQPPPIMNPAPPASIDVPNTKENATKVKAKGKVPLSMHKPPAVVLAPKNTNIMPRKSCSTLARSSRSTKERNASSTLNPAKHGALVMSSDSSHIALAKPSIKKNSSIVVQDNTQLNSTTAPPSTLEPITSGATSLVGFVPHLNGDYGIDANGMVE